MTDIYPHVDSLLFVISAIYLNTSHSEEFSYAPNYYSVIVLGITHRSVKACT